MDDAQAEQVRLLVVAEGIVCVVGAGEFRLPAARGDGMGTEDGCVLRVDVAVCCAAVDVPVEGCTQIACRGVLCGVEADPVDAFDGVVPWGRVDVAECAGEAPVRASRWRSRKTRTPCSSRSSRTWSGSVLSSRSVSRSTPMISAPTRSLRRRMVRVFMNTRFREARHVRVPVSRGGRCCRKVTGTVP